jgi:hypothetical protein
MTTDLTQPPAEMGAAPAVGQGQAHGHRRRRRRRKNKTSQQPGIPAQQGHSALAQPSPQPQVQAAPQRPPQRNLNQGRKKKFFQKGHAPQGQPGNSVHASSHGKRKNKQKGPREFVGPMDHSYRAVNGNVADGPPSTIQITSNGHGGHGAPPYPDAYHNQHQPPVAVRENAPTRIFCFIDDLFFVAKIQEAARKLGVKVEFVKGDKEIVARIADTPESARPKLLVFDLNNVNAKPMTLIPKFKLKLKKGTSIIGFLSHLQGDLKMKAVEAGCDTVMPRSAFSQSLPSLLRRYGAEEEEEYAQQPV